MKIICVLKNYSELKAQNSELITFYLKPETTLLVSNRPFYYPDYTKEIVCTIELVLKINNVGKYISEKFASKYYDEIGLVINMTALDLRKDCIDKKIPWDVSASFDNSAPISKFVNKNTFADLNNIIYQLNLNEKIVMKHTTSDLLFSFNKLVSHVSQFIILKSGDLIFTGARSEPVKIKIGDHLEGFINEQSVLKCLIK